MKRDCFSDRVHGLVKGLSLYPGSLSVDIVFAVVGRLSSHIEKSVSNGTPVTIWIAACELYQGCNGLVSRESLANALVSGMPSFTRINHIGRVAYLESLEMLRISFINNDQTTFLVGQREAEGRSGSGMNFRADSIYIDNVVISSHCKIPLDARFVNNSGWEGYKTT